MTELWSALSPAQQFWSGAAGSAAVIVMIVAAIVCGPDLLRAAKLIHRDLFPNLEDDERRLVEAKQRAREELRRQVPHQVDAGDRRALLHVIGQMSSPSNRIH